MSRLNDEVLERFVFGDLELDLELNLDRDLSVYSTFLPLLLSGGSISLLVVTIIPIKSGR